MEKYSMMEKQLQLKKKYNNKRFSYHFTGDLVTQILNGLQNNK